MKKLTAFLMAAIFIAIVALAISRSAKDFSDIERIADEHLPAVQYVSGKGIISGFPDGSFRPADTLTRAQAAKMLCVTLEGADKAERLPQAAAQFSDVPDEHWAAKYIAYCAEKGIVAGVGHGQFDPDGELSVCAFGKMLLVAYGHDPAEEGLLGTDWAQHTRQALIRGGYHKKLAAIADVPIDRESACQLICNFSFPEEETQS